MPSRLDVSISSLSRCKWAIRFSAVAAVLTFPAINSALADWWLVRSSDGKCLVVDIEPTDKDKNVTKIGKAVYQSAARLKRTLSGFAKMQSPPISLSLSGEVRI